MLFWAICICPKLQFVCFTFFLRVEARIKCYYRRNLGFFSVFSVPFFLFFLFNPPPILGWMDGVGLFLLCIDTSYLRDSSQKPAMTGSITFTDGRRVLFSYFFFVFLPLLCLTWRLFECSCVLDHEATVVRSALVLFQCHGPPGPAICLSSSAYLDRGYLPGFFLFVVFLYSLLFFWVTLAV